MHIEFTNGRGTVRLAEDSHTYALLGVDGLGGVAAAMQTTQAPGQDGTTLVALTAPARTITLTGALLGDDACRAGLRAQLSHIMTGRAGEGELTVTAYGRVRRIGAIVDTGAAFAEAEGPGIGWQRFTLSLYCPSPFFASTAAEHLDMAVRVGGLRFPLRLPTHFTQLNSMRRFIARNRGDVSCPLDIAFSGGSLNPKVMNLDTGEYIRINRAIPESATLHISTAFGRKRAYLEDGEGAITNAMGYLELGSTFFGLAVGDNEITFDADTGAATARVSMAWRERWVSV